MQFTVALEKKKKKKKKKERKKAREPFTSPVCSELSLDRMMNVLETF